MIATYITVLGTLFSVQDYRFDPETNLHHYKLYEMVSNLFGKYYPNKERLIEACFINTTHIKDVSGECTLEKGFICYENHLKTIGLTVADWVSMGCSLDNYYFYNPLTKYLYAIVKEPMPVTLGITTTFTKPKCELEKQYTLRRLYSNGKYSNPLIVTPEYFSLAGWHALPRNCVATTESSDEPNRHLYGDFVFVMDSENEKATHYPIPHYVSLYGYPVDQVYSKQEYMLTKAFSAADARHIDD